MRHGEAENNAKNIYSSDPKKYYLTDSEIVTRSLSWLMISIGALVLKGYLKIIPQIQINNKL